MRLGVCSRSGDVVEPRITPQWFVNLGDEEEGDNRPVLQAGQQEEQRTKVW